MGSETGRLSRAIVALPGGKISPQAAAKMLHRSSKTSRPNLPPCGADAATAESLPRLRLSIHFRVLGLQEFPLAESQAHRSRFNAGSARQGPRRPRRSRGGL